VVVLSATSLLRSASDVFDGNIVHDDRRDR
jgi:hypothetical protein